MLRPEFFHRFSKLEMYGHKFSNATIFDVDVIWEQMDDLIGENDHEETGFALHGLIAGDILASVDIMCGGKLSESIKVHEFDIDSKRSPLTHTALLITDPNYTSQQILDSTIKKANSRLIPHVLGEPIQEKVVRDDNVEIVSEGVHIANGRFPYDEIIYCFAKNGFWIFQDPKYQKKDQIKWIAVSFDKSFGIGNSVLTWIEHLESTGVRLYIPDLTMVRSNNKPMVGLFNASALSNLWKLVEWIYGFNMYINKEKPVIIKEFQTAKVSKRKEFTMSYSVVTINTNAKIVSSQPGHSGIKHRQHPVRGHARHYRDHEGNLLKTVWVKSHMRGDPNLGQIFHDYKVAE